MPASVHCAIVPAEPKSTSSGCAITARARSTALIRPPPHPPPEFRAGFAGSYGCADSAVDGDDCSVDVGPGPAGQEDRDAGHVVRAADAPERVARLDRAAHVRV